MNQQNQKSIHRELELWMTDIIMSRKKKQIYWKTLKTHNIKQFKLVKKFQKLAKQIRLKQLIECIKQFKLVKKFQKLAKQIRLKQLIECIKQFANHFTDYKLIKDFKDFNVHTYHSSGPKKQDFTQRASEFYNNPLDKKVDSISKKQNFKNYETVIDNYIKRGKEQLINKINNLKMNTNINNLSEINVDNLQEIKKYLTRNTSRGGGGDIEFTQNEATVFRRIIRFVLNKDAGGIHDYNDLCRNTKLLGSHSIVVAGIYDTTQCIYCNNHPKFKGLAHCGICKRK